MDKYIYSVVVETDNLDNAERVISAVLDPYLLASFNFDFEYSVYVSGDPQQC